MNVQVERQEDHTARLIVEIDDAMYNSAREKAARTLSKKVNIPGFRKGKAPLRIIVNYIGEAGLIEETVDQMSQEVYRQALIQSAVDPYGPGELVEVKTDVIPPSLIYIVPLQPTIELGGYRDMRLPYEPAPVTDEQVDRAMKALQQENALVEESARPAVLGNRVVLGLHSYFVDGIVVDDAVGDETISMDEDLLDALDEAAELLEEDEFDDEDDHDGHGHAAIDAYMSDDQEVYLHEHAMQFMLDSAEEPAPGFSEALVGITPGETREFTLTFPAEYTGQVQGGTLVGRTVNFVVNASKVESLTLPALTDDFAARVSKDEEKPLSLLELRIRMRENLGKAVDQRYQNEFIRQALEVLVRDATLAYPERMVVEHVESLLQEFDERLRRGGMTLDDYMKINQKTAEAVFADWRSAGVNSVERALVLQGLVNAERLSVDETRVEAELDRFVASFAEETRPIIRQQIAKDESMRDSVRSSVLQDMVFERLIAIAKGEAPPLPELILEAIEPALLSPSDGTADSSASTDTPESTVTSANEENS
ncbi:MAG: trigger factor [Chloroflexota bacterium]|nr:trigger factor [Chloroflexota bacterium]